MTIAQNASSQQLNRPTHTQIINANIDNILSDIENRIEHGTKTLSYEYEQLGKQGSTPCFTLLAEFRAQIANQCPHQPQLYLPLALSVLTAILQKNLRFSAHYVFLSAEPNANKTTTLNTISNCLKVLELDQSPQWPRSYPALYQQLEATQDTGMLMLVDEIFKKFRNYYTERDRADGEVFEKIIATYESSQFQAPLIRFDKPKAGEETTERKNLDNIRLSLIGSGTNGEFQQLLKSQQFTDGGWLSRMGLFRLFQNRELRSVSKILGRGDNNFKLGENLYTNLKYLNNWCFETVDMNHLVDHQVTIKEKTKHEVKLDFFCPSDVTDCYLGTDGGLETGNPWDAAMQQLAQDIDTAIKFFDKSGHSKYKAIFEELGGDRTYKKASYYAQLLWLSDAILQPQSPMGLELQAYFDRTVGGKEPNALYLPYTYFDMAIQIVRLMVLNLYSLMVEGLGDEEGTDFAIQKAILRVFALRQGESGIAGISQKEVSQYISNQYRGTIYRQARKDNLEELCYAGHIEPTIDKMGGKPYRGARYKITSVGIQCNPKIFSLPNAPHQ
jgi:hypothetical protein